MLVDKQTYLENDHYQNPSSTKYHLAVVAQIFNPTAELAIPTRTRTNETNPEIQTHPMTAETKTRKCSK